MTAVALLLGGALFVAGLWLLVGAVAGLYQLRIPLFPALTSSTTLDHGDLTSLAVAAGTLVLALATILLVGLTYRAVRVGQREAQVAVEAITVANRQADEMAKQATIAQSQADLARETLAAASRPILVDVPHGKYLRPGPFDSQHDEADIWVADVGDGRGARVYVSFRNIGAGPAIIQGLGIRSSDVDWNGKASSTLVAPNELTTLTFEVPADRPDLASLRESIRTKQTLIASVGYSGLSGDRWRSEAFIEHDARTDRWAVRQLALYWDDQQEPFVMSGPADG